MTPEDLSVAIRQCLTDAVEAQEIALEAEAIPEAPRVERPRQRGHGDWSTNVAMQLSKRAAMAPRDFAAKLAARLGAVDGVAAVEVAGPGFLNVTLEAAAAGELARTIVTQGHGFGRTSAMAGTTINVEFVSANPTGPIHIGGARWAAAGDAVSRTLEAQGATVVREYYFNDHGVQIDHFAASLLARARGQEVPENGYGGQYIEDIAAQVVADEKAAGRPDPTALPEAEAREVFRARGVEIMFGEIKKSLHDYGVDFDVYFHEEDLHRSGAVAKYVEELKASGALYPADGAWWLKSSDYGDDKDRVVIKSNGEAAYIAGDVAYFRDKRARGSDLCIYLLGADHHGYQARLKAVAAAFGDDPATVEVIIGQFVNLVRGGEPVRMSKRAGTIVTMDDLVEAVGVDASRYSLTRVSMDSPVDIDLDLISRRTNENPVFYVQYAHARTANVARNAAQFGVRREDGFDPAALTHPAETALLGVLGSYPKVVAQAAELREPHRVARYLEELAGVYHKWYDKCRVTPLGEEEVTNVHRSRLWLNDATRQVLANGLDMIGVSAPERM